MIHNEEIKDQIVSAIEELLSKKSVDDVTVTDIIKKANISRTTFYRYFQDKYDAMNWKITSEFTLLKRNNPSIEELPEHMHQMLQYAENNHKLIKKLLLYNGQNSFLDTMYPLMYEYWSTLMLNELNEEELPLDIVFAIKMYCYGGVNMMLERLVKGMHIDIDTYCQYLIDNIPPILKKYLHKKD